MIRLHSLSLNHGNRKVVENIHLELRTSKITTIVGRNGAGKSTLLAAASGELRPSKGKVYFGSKNASTLSSNQRALYRSSLSQHTEVTFSLTCSQLIEYGVYPAYNRLSALQRARICEEAADLLDVACFAERPIQELSGGERQRVWLAKCVAQLSAGKSAGAEGQALLLDEPTSSLDLEQQARFLQLVQNLAERRQVAVLCVLHDLNLAAQLSDEILLLHRGQCLAKGSPAYVFTRENLQLAMGVEFLVQQHECLQCPVLTMLHNKSKDTHYASYTS